MRFLDNVLQDFIDRAPHGDGAAPRYSAMRERSVGPGRDGLPLLPADAERRRSRARWPRRGTSRCSSTSARQARRGLDACWPRSAAPARTPPTAASMERFSLQDGDRADRLDLDHLRRHLAPASSRSPANIYTHKTLSGSFVGAQPVPGEAAGRRRAGHDEDIWTSITRARGLGAASRLPRPSTRRRCSRPPSRSTSAGCIEHAADRAPYICQSQSLNIFLPADVHKRDLHQIHMMAWKRGVKSLYYCRSLSHPARRSRRRRGAAPTPLGDHALSTPGLDAPAVRRSARRRHRRSRTTTKSALAASNVELILAAPSGSPPGRDGVSFARHAH